MLTILQTGQCPFDMNALHQNKYNAKYCCNMSIKKFLSLAKVDNALNDPSILSDLGKSESPINIAELPFDTVDCVTDK